jgi:membrane protein
VGAAALDMKRKSYHECACLLFLRTHQTRNALYDERAMSPVGSSRVKYARAFALDLFKAILSHNVVDLAAQLAYWSVLAFFPFAIFLLTVIGFLPLGNADRQLMSWLSPFMPESALNLIWDTVHEVLGKQRSGLLAISLIGGIWSAAGGMSALQTALNSAYGVDESRSYIKRKSRAIIVTLATVVLAVIAVAGATTGPDVLRAIVGFFGFDDVWGGFEAVWRWVRWPLTVASLIAMLSAAYKFLPDVEHGYGTLSVGSLAAVTLWLGATWGFRLFVSRFGTYTRTYGTLAAVVVLLTFIYLSGLAAILGAEVNATLVRERRRLIREKGGEPERGPLV